jgi:hypothetical protein
MTKLFDTSRDNEQIADGTHFYCKTHLCAVLISERSPDPSYCKGCCDFLLKEWDVIKSKGAI